MDIFNEIYELNKELDFKFIELYGNSNEIRVKNILALLVELGEFANETRCFKYWSVKKASSKEVTIEELADCLLLTMCLMHDLHVELYECVTKINQC